MSGEKQSKGYRERLSEFEKVLDEFIGNNGVGKVGYNPEIEIALNFTRSQIEQLNAEACGEYAILAANYSLYVQKQQNRNRVRKAWAERHLDHIVAQRYANYKQEYDKYEVVKDRISAADSDAQVLTQIILHSEARDQELDFLSRKIELLSNALSELQRTKRKL